MTKLRVGDYALIGTVNFPDPVTDEFGPDRRAIAFDGANIWVANPVSNTGSKR